MQRSESEGERTKFREALRGLPLEVLLKQQKEGAKEFNKLYFGKEEAAEKEELETSSAEDQKETITAANKKHKGRPLEASAKLKPKRKVEVFEVKKPKFIDPRFEETAGDFDINRFMNCYKFLREAKQNEVKSGEKTLKSKKKIKKLSFDEKNALKASISQNKQELRFLERNEKELKVKQSIKAEMKQKGINDPFVRKSVLNRSFGAENEGNT